MIDPATLPAEPGCYLFSDEGGNVIYVGKARNLRKRVSSYFSRHDLDPKTARLVDAIAGIDFIVTDTEVEAFILENTLIKKHQPKYNIDLKDSKTYAYIHITDEPFPRIHVARGPDENGRYYGPFVSARERDDLLRLLKSLFGLRSCRRLPRRACLRAHIGSCSAPCIGRIGEEEYGERVRRAEAVLKGDIGGLIRTLRDEMAAHAERLDYERAMDLRDQITALERLRERQHVDRQKTYNEDIINYIRSDGTVYLMLFNVDRGTLAGKHQYTFDETEGFLEEFLARYYADHEPPEEVILPEPVDDAVAIYLSHLRGGKVRLVVPQRGEKKNLLDLVGKNVEITFFGDRIKLEELRRRLHLPSLPVAIECFDISHLSGTAMVGSMVRFYCGKPDRRNYRRFRIRSVEGIDDFAAIAEVVRRRYTRLKKEDGEFPDLILIDGGKGQLTAATAVLRELGVSIPIAAIAKREEEVFIPGFSHPLPLDRHEKASLFIQEIRDEAHRFAITYHRNLRRKTVAP
ncbi:excinuclease ABC subunit UvrC [Methanoculleus receptaculi]|uniref:UvrABC system protein C n=1 Tax=Methanoculleus receptaculi TaxID=394967 RepID=A0AAX4FTH1_9EURY|nr:excinuclease ABC subunit UvrC [Methanoculleus receptaculi]WOX57047.1 excinuclease ABC subunit UvrC [Methanoculleus receptaculi]